ncbi:cholesterol esterase [Zygosaccharomyces mellis]|uniref:Cholesterol esterase n=1 Tax=Zygosaccharomyces mellis TaxID=42258 RepID=A0A4C2E534_9SACH|nr:cholesterol esterase [Zygosaccharomyces mellis]
MRISIAESAVICLVYLETFLALLLRLIPQKIIRVVTWTVNKLEASAETPTELHLRLAPTVHDMCRVFGIEVEDHLVRTEDDYILTLHRIAPKPGRFNGKVVYLHHGLLMCSDVWVCNIKRNNNLPFVLHDLGFDVWMGNNRGNKYSTAHLTRTPKSYKFWDFSIDEFAFFDIPNSVEFVLRRTKVPQLICIGFSQGSAQMFAAFSLSEELNRKVSQFIAISPAMTPRRLHNRIVDKLAKSSPRLMYLLFGRRVLLPTAVMWQKTLHPRIFNWMIEFGNRQLFNWKSKNITPAQKMVSYAKLYSTTSVKSVVHWFQILQAQKFQMFEESDGFINSIQKPYQIACFPTRTNIQIPILLIYGGNDSLVDIHVMKENLPKKRVFDIEVENHEHLDLIWGERVDALVIINVIKFIDFFDHSSSLLGETSFPKCKGNDDDDAETFSIKEGIFSSHEDTFQNYEHPVFHNMVLTDFHSN